MKLSGFARPSSSLQGEQVQALDQLAALVSARPVCSYICTVCERKDNSNTAPPPVQIHDCDHGCILALVSLLLLEVLLPQFFLPLLLLLLALLSLPQLSHAHTHTHTHTHESPTLKH